MKKKCSYIFLNFFIFTTTLSLFTSGSDKIYDSAGKKLIRGIPYYILPLLRGSGGGLTLSRTTTKDRCPLNVTQELFEANNGIPFTFKPIVLEEEIIRGAYPISIEPHVSNPCHASNILKVTTATTRKNKNSRKHFVNKKFKDNLNDNKKKDDDDDSKYVTIQIVTNDGEFNKPESCFQFVEDDSVPGLTSYQIQHCPSKCGSSSSPTGFSCYNVGIIKDEDGTGYLGHTDAIFPVVFTNAYGSFGRSDNGNMFSWSAKMSTFSQFMAKVSRFS